MSGNDAWWAEAGREFVARLERDKRPYRLETSPQRIHAARSEASSYVAALGDWLAGGLIESNDAAVEVAQLFYALAQRFGLSADERDAAERAEWGEAKRKGAERLEAIRRAIRGRAWEGADVRGLVWTAEAARQRTGASLSSDQLDAIILAVARPVREALDRRGRRR